MTVSTATSKRMKQARTLQLPRRDFLTMLGLGAGSAWLQGCGKMWSVPAELVEMALRGPGLETEQPSICGLCPAACGIRVRLIDGIPVGIKGNALHPLNHGGLCPVGHAGLELLYSPERLRNPMRRSADGTRRPVAWDEAIADISSRLSDLHDAGSGHRIAILNDEPGQLLDELGLRFGRVFGSANVSRSTLDPVLGYTLTQGVAEIPGFDLARSDLVLSFGLDLFEDGPTPMLAIASMVGQRGYEDRAHLVHVGTRLSPTASRADERLPINPGSFAAAALGIAHVLVREGKVDHEFLADHSFGYHDWTDGDGEHQGFERYLLENYYPDRAARLCGCNPVQLVSIARRMAAAERPVAVVGGEAVLGADTTFTVMAVHALNALLGAFDREGGVVMPDPIEFSGLSELAEPEHPSCFEPPSTLFGVDPVRTLADGILDGSRPIELLVLVNSNPVHESPHGDRLREALQRVPMVVAMSSFLDESAACADYVLPSPMYLETWRTVTTPPGTPFSVLGVGTPVIEPLHDTRHPADILLELTRRANPAFIDSMPWASHVEYLKDRLRGLVASGQGSVISGSFEESWAHFLEQRGWRFLQHQGVESFWDGLTAGAGWWNPVRTHGDWDRMFPTRSGCFEFHSQKLARHLRDVGAAQEGTDSTLDRGAMALGLRSRGDETCRPHQDPPAPVDDGQLVLVPFRPITGRGGLGTLSPMVLAMYGYSALSAWQTWVEIAPTTAHHLDLHDGDTVRIESSRAGIEAMVHIQAGAVPGVASISTGLGHQEIESAADGIGSNPMNVVVPGRDPLSGATSLAMTPVRLHLLQRRKHGAAPPEHGGHG